jgi:hypothetical protein
MLPIMEAIRPFTKKFEIHNEPNHETGLEGWGSSNADALSFREWFLLVAEQIRYYAPWASLGFPGLAPHHRDLTWLKLCRPAIEAADWLGVHCYWQYDNNLDPDWGLRFLKYHERFPNMPLEMTEFGDSSPDLDEGVMAKRYVEYYKELMRYPFLKSASAFILSSQDPQWEPFAWRLESGKVRQVAYAVGEMVREPATAAPAYVNLIGKLRTHQTKRYSRRSLDQVEMIVIHHSASPPETTPQSMANYHVLTRGMPGIAYARVVGVDGTIYGTQPLTASTWHSNGFGDESIGICLPGSFMRGRLPSPEQIHTLNWMLGNIYKKLGRVVPWVAHKELPDNDTACPGSEWDTYGQHISPILQ